MNVALRYDGSSRLASGNKWASFPSASLAWRLSEENFIKAITQISSLKIRASYGVTGNQAIDPYQTQTVLTNNNYSWNNVGFYTKIPGGLANKNLSWELTATTNIGLDWGLFNNRISGSLEVYKTISSDLLMRRTLPSTTGFPDIWQNIGKTENKGIELTLIASPIQTKKINWELTGTFSRNYGKIVELVDNKNDLANNWIIGQPLNIWYNYKMLGIWQISEATEAAKFLKTPGEVKNLDLNGDSRYTPADYVVLGQRDPKYIASLMSSLSLYNFDFSFTIVAQGGNLIRPARYADIEYNGEKWVVSGVKFWTPLNPTNEFARVQTSQGHNEASGLGYMDGSFGKVQEITLGYTIPKNILSKIKIGECRFYLQGKNAFYLYKKCKKDVNPEAPDVEFTIPITYVAGINLSF